MSEELDTTLKWSAQYTVTSSSSINKRLSGDKIVLPQAALEQLLAAAPIVTVNDHIHRPYTASFNPYNEYSFAAERHARDALASRQQQLPYPLTFRLVNPQNGRVVYAGIREFSASEGEIGLSPVLQEALAVTPSSTEFSKMTDVLQEKQPQITVHHKSLPKGTYVKLRPLEAGYDIEDWKALLERYLRDNFTTLTSGEVLSVQDGREKFRFLVDKIEPPGEAICVVDTDLEVDIEAMSEEQARETLNRRMQKANKASGTAGGSSVGGVITVGQEISGQVLGGEYIDFELKSWNRGRNVEISTVTDGEHDVDILVNPFSSHLTVKPRLDEYMFGELDSRPHKKMKLSHTNVDLEGAEHLNISVHAYKDDHDGSPAATTPFTITISQPDDSSTNGHSDSDTLPQPGPDETVCRNCQRPVPSSRLFMHENFCLRNNISCSKCHEVFLKTSPSWQSHWHCPHDSSHGSSPTSKSKHDALFHPTSTLQCPSCPFTAYNLPILAHHRTTSCPSKLILCQFCHLLVPQCGADDPDPMSSEVLISGLTSHEYADGSRTTECHLCSRIVRLRDMRVHLQLHDRERLSRTAPRLCSNAICGRTIKVGDENKVQAQQLGLCNECFGPLYISTYDPEGKALRRRVERRLLTQLMAGCGKVWCHNNEWCRTARKNDTGEDRVVTAKEALPLVRPVLDAISKGDNTNLRFCVDEQSQSRRTMGEMVAAEGVYELSWCLKALEEEHGNLGKVGAWLADRAPTKAESKGQ